MNAPTRVAFTQHGARRCAKYGRGQAGVGDLLLSGHRRRRRNVGSGDWLLVTGGIAIVYDWPDRDDATTARVVTVWPQR